jgi:hypothetical protein
MKLFLEKMINKLHKNNLSILYGDGSYVKINEIKLLTSTNNYQVDCRVFVTDPEKSVDNFPDGISYIIEDCWKLCGMEFEGVMVLSELDVT